MVTKKSEATENQEKENLLVTLPASKTAIRGVFIAGNTKGIDKIINQVSGLKDEFLASAPALTERNAIKEHRSFVAKLRKVKARADDIGKELKAEIMKEPKMIDANRNVLRDGIDSIIAEIMGPVEEIEKAEKERVAAIESKIGAMKAQVMTPLFEPLSVEELENQLESLKSIEISEDDFQEFTAKAVAERNAAIAKLALAIDSARQKEAHQKEMEEKQAKLDAEAEQLARERAEFEAMKKAAALSEKSTTSPESDGFQSAEAIEQQDVNAEQFGNYSSAAENQSSANPVQFLDCSAYSAISGNDVTVEMVEEATRDIMALGFDRDDAEMITAAINGNEISHINFSSYN